MRRQQLKELGLVQGRRLRVWLQYGDRKFKATLRRTHRITGKDRETVFVVPGRLLLPHLSKTKREALHGFSKKIGFLRHKHDLTALEAYKALLLGKAPGLPKKFGRVRAVPWDLGPVPVLEVGVINGIALCATPLALSTGSDQQAALPMDQGREAYLEILHSFLIECLEDYFAEISDILRGACLFADKKHALEASRKIRRRLSLSVNQKLQDITPDADAATGVATLQAKICHDYELELQFYRASAAVVTACSSLLAWSAGSAIDYQSALEEARDAVSQIYHDDPDAELLAGCIDLLGASPERDALSPLYEAQTASRPWLDDLRHVCQFLHHLRSLATSYGRGSTFIFVTHHMDVYASEEFYRQLQHFAHSKWPKKNVVVWTGYGRQKDIELAILARLWLSHAQVLYIPNSFDSRQGQLKTLRTSNDWVVEELAYGALIEKPLHLVIAEGADACWQSFEAQIDRYDWKSLPASFGADSRLFESIDLPARLRRHKRTKTYTSHRPARSELTPATHFVGGLFVPALKNGFRQAMWTLRLSLSADDWLVVQALYRASQQRFGVTRPTAVTAEEIAHEARAQRRKDGKELTVSWILKRLRRSILGTVLSVQDGEIPIVVEDQPRARRKTFVFSLGTCISVYAQAFGLSVPADELEPIFLQVLSEPVRSQS